MLVKNEVLFEFKNVRSFERVDLLCSLLDLCLPYELRFLGTCLEFLGKRDFSELREDERDANNVHHLSSFRSLMDENTRRKLVLYVSLLKSCNTDCANCLNETLTALSISDVNRLCRSEPENAEKALDELLLLYTIAVKHPAFNIHQKADFAEHLRCLEEEDHSLSLILYPADDDNSKSSRLSKQSDSIPESICKPSESLAMSNLNHDGSSQISVISQSNPLTCHVLSNSVYTSAVLPSPLHQASAACLSPAQVMVSAVSAPVIQTPADGHPEAAQSTQSRLNSDSGHSVIAVGLAPSPVNSGLMMGAAPGPGGPGPGPGMVVPLAPSTSHCMLPSSGELGVQKGSLGHPSLMASVMCVTPESISMSYAGPSPYGMVMPVPLVGHVPGPPLGTALTPTPAPGSTPAPKSASIPASPFSLPMSNPSKEGANYEEGEMQTSRPPSPCLKVPSPPVAKTQVSGSKGPAHSPPQAHPHQQPFLGPPNHSNHMPFQAPPNMFPSAQQLPPPLAQLSPKPNSSVINQMPRYPNQLVTVGSSPFPAHVIIKPSAQWHSPGDNLKEAIVREMPKYKANLQDLSPDELLHMGDEQLKEIGLPSNAIQQLRSIMNKLHSTNGMNCLNRNDAICHSECPGPRRKHLNASDVKAGAPSPVNHGFVVPSSHPGGASNGSSFGKGSKRQQLQITNQVRALQLDDDSKRPASNSSSTSDCSSGSHSPPETPSEARSNHFERGYSGKDSGAESWNSTASEDKNKEERLHEVDCLPDDKMRVPPQPPGVQRNSLNRSRGMSKAPPGIPTMPRGRGHPMPEKHRRDPVTVTVPAPGPACSMNGVPPEMNNPPPPSAYAMSASSGMPSNIPYPPTTPVSSFLPHTQFTTMHAFQRFQSNSFVPAGTAYHFPHNGEMWCPYPQPQPTPPFITTPIVAFSPAHPPPKLSCYNCGQQGHQGSDCKESTFEEITQQGQYHLDYQPGECRDPDK